MLSYNVVCDVAVSLGYVNILCVPLIGRSGGLALFFKKDVVISSMYKDVRFVDVSVKYNGLNFYLSCVYGYSVQKYSHEFWK